MVNCCANQKAENGKGNRTHQLTAPKDNFKCEQSEKTYNMFNLTGPHHDPIITHIEINGKALLMVLGTGATLSVISEKTFRTTGKTPHGRRSKPQGHTLRTYTGQYVTIRVRNRVQHDLPLMVVPGGEPSLLGRNWPTRTGLEEIHQFKSSHMEKKIQNHRLQMVLN